MAIGQQYLDWKTSIKGTTEDPDGPLGIMDPDDPTGMSYNKEKIEDVAMAAFIAGATVRGDIIGASNDVRAWMEHVGEDINEGAPANLPPAQKSAMNTEIQEAYNGLVGAVQTNDYALATAWSIQMMFILLRFTNAVGLKAEDCWYRFIGDRTGGKAYELSYSPYTITFPSGWKAEWADECESMYSEGGGA